VASPSFQPILVPAAIKVLGWLVGGLFHLTRWLPERLTAAISAPMGKAVRRKSKRRILDQVEQALGPFAGPDAEDQFWDLYCSHFGRCLFESFHLTWMNDTEVIDRVELVGEEHLTQALAGGRGAVLLLNHLGCTGALVAAFGMRGYPTAYSGNRIEVGTAGRMWCLDGIEALVQRMYRRVRVERVLLGEDLPKRMTAILKQNGLFGLFMDHPVVWKSLQPIPFERCNLTLNLGPAILALRHRVPVLAVTALRTGLNHHRVTIKPLEVPAGARGTDAAAGLIEAAISQMLIQLRDHPDQWWPWEHAPLTPFASADA